jgi:hypothetical protein
LSRKFVQKCYTDSVHRMPILDFQLPIHRRMSRIDERLEALESSSPSAQASSSSRSATDHEPRIAQLEAQVYALQLAISSIPVPPPPPLQLQQAQVNYASSNMYPLPLQSGGHSMYHLHTPIQFHQTPPTQYSSVVPNSQTPQSYLNDSAPSRGSGGQSSHQPPPPPRMAYSNGPENGHVGHVSEDIRNMKRESPRSLYDEQLNANGGSGGAVQSQAYREKRMRSEPNAPRDLVARGMTSEEEDLMCYEA